MLVGYLNGPPTDGGPPGRPASAFRALEPPPVMKTSLRLFLAAVVAAAGLTSLSASPAAPFAHPTLKVVNVPMPAYPTRLQFGGIHQGSVELLFEVGTDGTVSDWLITAYTHRDFARSTEVVVPKWTFQPSDIVHVVELTLNFETRGVIALVRYSGMNLEGRGYVYRPCAPAELDQRPRPVNLVSPAYSDRMAADGAVGVVQVYYYIDQRGRVRMPYTTSTAHPLLAALVVDAVKQWQFEPPTCRGRPTLVKAEQAFRFGDAIAQR